jgi:hypothetical protein
LFEQLCQQQNYVFRQGVYSVAVVVWLMIWRRLQGNGSLAAAVQFLRRGGAGELLADGKRWQQDEVSVATGGYCQARQKLPTLLARQVSERIVEQLRSEMQEGWGGLQRPVFAIDGSTPQLQHTAALVEAFPPAVNQLGEGHEPVMRIVVLHDVFSGLALTPVWGAKYGANTVSEQSLAQAALDRLPPEAVVLGDGNFRFSLLPRRSSKAGGA